MLILLYCEASLPILIINTYGLYINMYTSATFQVKNSFGYLSNFISPHINDINGQNSSF